eukprot:Clim_evm2s84 gene=Clim_evmTU2s84
MGFLIGKDVTARTLVIQEDTTRQEDDYEILSDADPTKIYTIVEQLGSGTKGKVYKARHSRTKEVVAIKIHHLAAESNVESLRVHPRHPNIIEYTAAYRHKDELWLVMEFMDAGSLADVIERNGPLSEEFVAFVTQQILRGLTHAQSLGMYHHNINARNLLVNSAGVVKLSELGLATRVTQEHREMGFLGSPHWMPPEAMISPEESPYEEGGESSYDMWSLGISMIELAEGGPPLVDVHPVRVVQLVPTRPSPSLRNADRYSDEFNHMIKLCLAKNWRKRIRARDLQSHPFVSRPVVTSPKLTNEFKAFIREFLASWQGEGRHRQIGEDFDGEEDDVDFEHFGKDVIIDAKANETMMKFIVNRQSSLMGYNVDQSDVSSMTDLSQDSNISTVSEMLAGLSVSKLQDLNVNNRALRALARSTPIRAPGSIGPGEEAQGEQQNGHTEGPNGERRSSPMMTLSRTNSAHSLISAADNLWSVDAENWESDAVSVGGFDAMSLASNVSEVSTVSGVPLLDFLDEMYAQEFLTFKNIDRNLRTIDFPEPVLCAEYFGPKSLLIGTTTGLYLVTKGNTEPRKIIRQKSFHKIHVMYDLEAFTALCGKSRSVRIYYLSKSERKGYVLAKNRFAKRTNQVIPGTQGCRDFTVNRIDGLPYLVMCFPGQIAVFVWAPAPYNRFMKYKLYNLQEDPLIANLVNPDNLQVVYGSEAGFFRIDVSTSGVFQYAFSNGFHNCVPREIIPESAKGIMFVFDNSFVSLDVFEEPAREFALHEKEDCHSVGVVNKHHVVACGKRSIELHSISTGKLAGRLTLGKDKATRFLTCGNNTIAFTRVGTRKSTVYIVRMEEVDMSDERVRKTKPGGKVAIDTAESFVVPPKSPRLSSPRGKMAEPTKSAMRPSSTSPRVSSPLASRDPSPLRIGPVQAATNLGVKENTRRNRSPSPTWAESPTENAEDNAVNLDQLKQATADEEYKPPVLPSADTDLRRSRENLVREALGRSPASVEYEATENMAQSIRLDQGSRSSNLLVGGQIVREGARSPRQDIGAMVPGQEPTSKQTDQSAQSNVAHNDSDSYDSEDDDHPDNWYTRSTSNASIISANSSGLSDVDDIDGSTGVSRRVQPEDNDEPKDLRQRLMMGLEARERERKQERAASKEKRDKERREARERKKELDRQRADQVKKESMASVFEATVSDLKMTDAADDPRKATTESKRLEKREREERKRRKELEKRRARRQQAAKEADPTDSSRTDASQSKGKDEQTGPSVGRRRRKIILDEETGDQK